MELFGILLSFPAALIASLIYAAVVRWGSSAWPWIRRPLLAGSYVVFTGLAVELAILAILGAVEGHRLLGPAFYVGHLITFLLGTPALANVLVLQRRAPGLSRLWIASLSCAFFALFLVLLQYSVSESLYGIDGDNDQFSQPPGATGDDFESPVPVCCQSVVQLMWNPSRRRSRHLHGPT